MSSITGDARREKENSMSSLGRHPTWQGSQGENCPSVEVRASSLATITSGARGKEDAMPSLGWHPIWQGSQGGKCPSASAVSK